MRETLSRPGSPPAAARTARWSSSSSRPHSAVCQNAGAEFILYDMEHTGLSFETLKMQVACVAASTIVPMVRVPRGEYHFIARRAGRRGAGRHGADGRQPRKPRTSRPARAIRQWVGAVHVWFRA